MKDVPSCRREGPRDIRVQRWPFSWTLEETQVSQVLPCALEGVGLKDDRGLPLQKSR